MDSGTLTRKCVQRRIFGRTLFAPTVLVYAKKQRKTSRQTATKMPLKIIQRHGFFDIPIKAKVVKQLRFCFVFATQKRSLGCYKIAHLHKQIYCKTLSKYGSVAFNAPPSFGSLLVLNGLIPRSKRSSTTVVRRSAK